MADVVCLTGIASTQKLVCVLSDVPRKNNNNNNCSSGIKRLDFSLLSSKKSHSILSFHSKKPVLRLKVSCFVQSHVSPSSSSLSVSHKVCSDASTTTNDSFTVTYLIECCGLSRDSALRVSRYVNFQNPYKPNRVLAFLRSHGFSDAQIAKVVRGQPSVLKHIPERSLVPKFQYFYSKGFTKPELARILSACPRTLGRSLEKHIIPTFNFYKDLFESDKKFVAALKNDHWLLSCNPKDQLAPRMELFRSYGIPESSFIKFIQYRPRYLILKTDTLRRNIEKVREVGFDPKSMMFISALKVLTSLDEASWEKKVTVYERWGWSRDTVIMAFRKYPYCMAMSEEKITAVMDYFVNDVGCESSVLARRPHILNLSLEKRIIPRISVLKFLREKSLIKKKCSWIPPLVLSEELFLERFIYRYEKEAPELSRIYKEMSHPTTPEQDIQVTQTSQLGPLFTLF